MKTPAQKEVTLYAVHWNCIPPSDAKSLEDALARMRHEPEIVSVPARLTEKCYVPVASTPGIESRTRHDAASLSAEDAVSRAIQSEQRRVEELRASLAKAEQRLAQLKALSATTPATTAE